jgi:hypothetical protein
MPEPANSKRKRRMMAKEHRRSERRSAARRRWAVRLIVVAAVVGGIAAAIVFAIGQSPRETTEVAATVSERYEVADEGADHVDEGTLISYRHTPPSSGRHYGRPSAYGVYASRVPEGAWVHNLEHGGIVLLFKCSDDCESKAAEIEPIYGGLPSGAFGEVKFVATPYQGAPTDYTLLAWGWQEDLDSLDPARIERFYRDRVDKGPENAP